MPHIDQHPPGAFCWIELATSDQPAAKSFYGSLFGWAVEDFPMGPNDYYSMFRLEGRDAAAGYTLRADQKSRGVPPHWMLYVAVDSSDAAANTAARLGGKVHSPPSDVYDVGRMAVLGDPSGAVFAIWQPKRNKGTGITGVDGTLCWADLMTPDPTRVKDFYSSLFGWNLIVGEKDASGYMHIKNAEKFIGGIPPRVHLEPHVPPHWLPYFLVSDCDAAVAKAQQIGAKLHLASMSMEGVGRWAVVADPQGAVFAVFQSAHHH